jgi:hypothetical protein
MEWSDISSIVAKYAPLVATTLSSPLGAAIGAGTIIANMFGVDATPDSVMDYINNNPEKAQEKISVFEMIKERNRHEEQIKEIEFKNVENARNNSVNVNASPVDNNIKMILVIGQFIALGACILLFYMFRDGMEQSLVVTIGALMGSLTTSIYSMVNYYWGTSFGSQKKDEVIASKRN